MSLSIRDQLALIYTSAGSLRGVALQTGLSHQKIGRILHGGEPGWPIPSARVMRDVNLYSKVAEGFEVHKSLVKGQALADGIPYVDKVPIFYARLPLKDGTPGDRVTAQHTHFITPELREKWLEQIYNSGKFHHISIASLVNLQIYSHQADIRADAQKRRRRKPRDRDQRKHRGNIEHKLQQKIRLGKIYTEYTPMGKSPSFAAEDVVYDLEKKLRRKHEPATGMVGTALATEYLLQVDTRNGKDNKFRNKHPYAKPHAKARRAKPRAKAGGRASARKR